MARGLLRGAGGLARLPSAGLDRVALRQNSKTSMRKAQTS